MALIPKSNLNGLPEVSETDLRNADPARLNRILNLLASQIQSVQTGKPSSTGITNQTTILNIAGGGSSGGGGSTPVSTLVTIQGTHAERLSIYLAPNESVGTYYYETDRTVLYLDFEPVPTVQVWQYVSGIYFDAFASQPADLGTYDAGFLFYATDRRIIYEWDGSGWIFLVNIGPILQDTYANWTLANYDPADYPPGTQFGISDWRVIYWVKIVAGNNKWVYLSGTYEAAYASKPTTGFNAVALGANDTGLLFYDNATYIRKWEWGGAAWKYASGELPGGDTGPACILIAGVTVPGGWHFCDTTTFLITKSDATTVSFVSPATANLFIEGGTYTGSGASAVAPGITAPANTGISGPSPVTGTSGVDIESPQTVQSGTGATVPAEPHTHLAGYQTPAHSHSISTITADNTGKPAAIVFGIAVKL